VLCDCAQTVLRTSRAASSAVLRVGHAAMKTPTEVTDTLDAATSRNLDKKGEREVRGLMEAILASVREGREAAARAKECTDKAADGAQIVLSLIRLPPNPERLASAVGAEALGALMCRVADVLSEMATAVGEAAERAMSTAVAVEAMHRSAAQAGQTAREAQSKQQAAASEASSSSSGSDDSEDEDVKKATAEAKRKAAEEEAKRKADEEAAKEAEEETSNPEAHLGPGAKTRLANVRLLRKLLAELRDSQAKLRELVSAVPQLLPGVTVAQKESVFQQLAELLAAAEQPIAQRWYESGPRKREAEPSAPPAVAMAEPPNRSASADAGTALDEWVAFVTQELAFVFHAADVTALPVPASLEARLLRQAALIDGELTKQMLHSQLLQRVMLFAPETALNNSVGDLGLRSQRPQLLELSSRLEEAIGKLTAALPAAK